MGLVSPSGPPFCNPLVVGSSDLMWDAGRSLIDFYPSPARLNSRA